MTDLNDATIAMLEAVEREAWCDMYDAAPEELRAALGFRVERVRAAAALVLPAIDMSDFNRVIGLGVEEPATEAVLDHFLAIYRNRNLKSFLIHVAPNAQPANLRDWLATRGLAPTARRWAKMWLQEPPAAGNVTELSVEEANRDTRMDFGKAVCAGFGMPDAIAPWSAALVGRKNWRAFVAKDDGESIGAGALYLNDGAAWLGVGATRPSHRRRGAHGAIMARRVAEGFSAGARWAVTEGAEDMPGNPNPSFHNMVRNGFQVAYMRENYGLPR